MCYLKVASKNAKYRSFRVLFKKVDLKATAVLCKPYHHVYACVYKKPTGIMKICMVARVVKQCLEMTPTESHNQKR